LIYFYDHSLLIPRTFIYNDNGRIGIPLDGDKPRIKWGTSLPYKLGGL
jgi:hypothetical protein